MFLDIISIRKVKKSKMMVVTETLILEAICIHSTGISVSTTHPWLVPQLRIHGAVPHLSHIIEQASRNVGHMCFLFVMLKTSQFVAIHGQKYPVLSTEFHINCGAEIKQRYKLHSLKW